MKNKPQFSDLDVFCAVVRCKSFSGAANEIGASPAFVSKRIQVLEKTLDCKLLNRSTRNVSLTEDGKYIYEKSRRILIELDNLKETATQNNDSLSGTLSVVCSLGLGRLHLAPILSELMFLHPKLTLKLDTIDNMIDLVQHGIDIDIRVGNVLDPNIFAKRLLANQRILCAAPDYLKEFGYPLDLNDLQNHGCLVTKERDQPFGLWRFDSSHGERRVKVSPKLSSNNGEVVKNWALAGHGIMLRSEWEIQDALRQGALIHILKEYWQDADIWAVYPSRLNESAKLKLCLDFIMLKLHERIA